MLKRFAAWFEKHTAGVALYALGMLTGLLIFAPLVPWSLPDSTANVLGAALGAIVAVWGAAWVSDRKERRRRFGDLNAIGLVITPLMEQAMLLVRSLRAISRDDVPAHEIRDVLDLSKTVKLFANETTKRLDHLQPIFMGLGGVGAVAYGQFKSGVGLVNDAVDQPVWGAMYGDNAARQAEVQKGAIALLNVLTELSASLQNLAK